LQDAGEKLKLYRRKPQAIAGANSAQKRFRL
jgi:hypothetical protein